MNRCYGNESNRSIAGINNTSDSFATARINFVLRACNTVRPSTRATKEKTIWLLCRDLSFCRIYLGLGRTLFSNTNLTDRSIKRGNNFHFFGKILPHFSIWVGVGVGVQLGFSIRVFN